MGKFCNVKAKMKKIQILIYSYSAEQMPCQSAFTRKVIFYKSTSSNNEHSQTNKFKPEETRFIYCIYIQYIINTYST